MSEKNDSETSMIGSATPEENNTPPAPQAAPDPAPSSHTAEPEGGEQASVAEAEGTSPEPAPTATFDDLTLPEGLEIPEETGTQFLELINNDMKPQERAQAFLDLHHSLVQQTMQQTAEAYAEQWEQTQADWQRQVQELPGIGGDNLDASLGQIAKVLDRYGDQEAREALNVTGAGNHPALVRLFHAIAKDLNEKPPVRGAPATGSPQDRASRMFGNTEK
jgi:hypothetical protein